MELDKLNRWLTLLANFGVVACIVFLGLEVHQNQSHLTSASLRRYHHQVANTQLP